jgi:hypothetical protein
MSVFPNPSPSDISISFEKLENENVNIAVFSMDGKKVWRKILHPSTEEKNIS